MSSPLSPVNQLPPNKHLYRRVLPQSCIPFASEQGKRLFKEALAAGHMECYFKLAAQFRTQDEPAFCGLTTMVMVLNALDMDPGRIWKGPWRWYHENMLDCCVPLEVVERQGITFDEFLCVAACNSLDVKATRIVEGAMSVDEFREIVKDYTQRDDAFIVSSYYRPVLGQTGGGHFSPIGGYHPGQDLVLILDTARFKYPPHWVSVQLLYDSMKALDVDLGQSRGVLLVSPISKAHHLILFRLANNMSLTAPSNFSKCIVKFMLNWKNKLNSKCLTTESLGIEVTNSIIEQLLDIKNSIIILTTQLDISCPEEIAKQHECVVHKLIEGLEKTELFSMVRDILQELSNEKLTKLDYLFGNASTCCTKTCPVYEKLSCAHFLTFFILSWPYEESSQGEVTLGDKTLKMVSEQLAKDDILADEAEVIRKQLKVLAGVSTSSKENVTTSCCNKKTQSSKK